MMQQLKEAAAYLRGEIGDLQPMIGLITGTGLGDVAELMGLRLCIPYSRIPHFSPPTTEGHRGNLLAGVVEGIGMLAMEGRLHPYEGYPPEKVTFPVRLMALCGVRYLFISSAAGGINPDFQKGDLVALTDHINMTGLSALRGPNLDAFGPRFPDMSEVYDKGLLAALEKRALDNKIGLKRGIYVGVLGPSLETPAETRFYRMAGGDVIGMSTVLEATVAVHCGMKVLAVVVVTNVNLPDCMGKTSLETVIQTAAQKAPSLAALWKQMVLEISRRSSIEP